MNYLKNSNGYVVRKDKEYDRLHAMDREMLFKFLNDTQPDEMEALRKVYKQKLEETLISYINAEVTKARSSSLDILKHGIEISNIKLATVYKGNIIKNLIMDCQSYTKYRPNETTGGIFVSWRRKEELPTGA